MNSKLPTHYSKLEYKASGISRPFDFDVLSVSQVLSKAKKDVYVGCLLGNELIAIYSLRGLDEGYGSPMFGVFVSPNARQKGVSTLCLAHSISYCSFKDFDEVLLKVYESNRRAKQVYERMGFTECGTSNSQIVMRKKLKKG